MSGIARRASVAAVVVGAIALLAACTPLNTQEQYLFHEAQVLRANNGLKPIYEIEPLTAKARAWAATLAAQGYLAHEDLHALGVAWTEAGENVGRASSIEEVERLLEASPTHRGNILNPDYTLAGFGTARGKDGSVYAVELFIRN